MPGDPPPDRPPPDRPPPDRNGRRRPRRDAPAGSGPGAALRRSWGVSWRSVARPQGAAGQTGLRTLGHHVQPARARERELLLRPAERDDPQRAAGLEAVESAGRHLAAAGADRQPDSRTTVPRTGRGCRRAERPRRARAGHTRAHGPAEQGGCADRGRGGAPNRSRNSPPGTQVRRPPAGPGRAPCPAGAAGDDSREPRRTVRGPSGGARGPDQARGGLIHPFFTSLSHRDLAAWSVPFVCRFASFTQSAYG